MSRIFSLIVHISEFQISKKLCLIVTPLVGLSFCTFVRLENEVDLLQREHLKLKYLKVHVSHSSLWNVFWLSTFLCTQSSLHLIHPPLTPLDLVPLQQHTLMRTVSTVSRPTQWVSRNWDFQFSVQYPGITTMTQRSLTKNKALLGMQRNYKGW